MRTIEAVYEGGLLRPVEPLGLAEGARVSVSVAEAGSGVLTSGSMLVESTPGEKTPDELLAEVAALPMEGTPPMFTARDLRGWMRRRAAVGTLLDEEALDRLDAAQAAPRRSPDRRANAGER